MKKALSSIPSGGKQGKKEGKKELRAGGRGRGRVEIVREGDRVEITIQRKRNNRIIGKYSHEKSI